MFAYACVMVGQVHSSMGKIQRILKHPKRSELLTLAPRPQTLIYLSIINFFVQLLGSVSG